MVKWMSRLRALLTFVIFLAVLAAFGQVLDFDFVNFDDGVYVYENPHLIRGFTWKGLRWAFEADFVFDSAHADYWQPVTALSRMLDFELWGSRPAGHHLTNLLLHAANAWLIFLILHRMTGSLWRSFWVACVFALHPVQADPVAWVTARKDVLSVFFGLLTLLGYLASVEKPRVRLRLATAFFYLAALLSKPALITLPLLLLLLDLWPLARMRRPWAWQSLGSRLSEKSMLLALALAACVLTLASPSGTVSHAFEETHFSEIGVSYLRYLWKAVYPVHLAIVYPFLPPLAFWQSAGAFFVLALVACAATFHGFRAPYLAVGWWWFAIALAPGIGLRHETRFLYFPILGLAFMCWGLPDIAKKWKISKGVVAFGAFSLVLAWGINSWSQAPRWKDTVSLFEDALRATRMNTAAHAGMGYALYEEGRVAASIDQFREALRIQPNNVRAHMGLGKALESLGRLDDALKHHRAAVKLRPHWAQAQTNLGIALTRKGLYEEAVSAHREAVRLGPDAVDAQNDLGVALALADQSREAVRVFRQAIETDPDHVVTRLNLGRALAESGRLDEAMRHVAQALAREPDLPEAHQAMADLLLKKGKWREGLKHLEAAAVLRPEDGEIRETIEKLKRESAEPVQASQGDASTA
jgi:tetratricopeptide (TPR) repeat protein